VTEFPSGSQPAIKAECAEVLAEVWTLLDGECSPETQDKLRQHLEDCPPCFQAYGLEERIKGLISTKCRGERAPVELRQRLMLHIRKTTIVIDPDDEHYDPTRER
jgi:mycothiol system anti-sigma-R factor